MLIDLTVNQQMPQDDGKNQMIELKALVNMDHVKMVIPRVEGGCAVTFADRQVAIVKETKKEISLLVKGIAVPQPKLAPPKKGKKK